MDAVDKHQELLKQNNIGVEVEERERILVNARRVGLEAPPFADEVEQNFMARIDASKNKKGSEKKDDHEQNVRRVFSR